jgi:KRAB domain-containing zinc finger protein
MKKDMLPMHIYRKHGGIVPEAQICDVCAFSCLSKTGMRQHKNIEHLGLVFNCKECDFSSHHKQTVVNHESSVHGKEDPKLTLRCHLCDYKNAYGSNLQIHLEAKHTHGKMFFCDQCNFKSPYPGSIKSHERLHDKSCWFQCNLCSYRCAQKANLKTHLDGKHRDISNSRYPCPTCDYVAHTKPDLSTHKKALHHGKACVVQSQALKEEKLLK